MRRYAQMSIDAHEFIRRFLLHVLPDGFHRIRHCGLFAIGARADNLAKARALLQAPPELEAEAPTPQAAPDSPTEPAPCSCCGGRMILIALYERGPMPETRARKRTPIRCDSS